MSSSAIQVAKTVTYLPDLVEVQRASFKWFLDKGLDRGAGELLTHYGLHRQVGAALRRK